MRLNPWGKLRNNQKKQIFQTKTAKIGFNEYYRLTIIKMGTKSTYRLTRRQWIKTALAFGVTPFALTACTRPESLVLAGHVWPGYEFVHMAKGLNWLDTEGLQLLETASASESMNALRNGRANAAMLTMDEMLRLCSEGMDLKVALIFNISMGADVVLSRPEITRLSQLEGKRIGVENSALGALMLHELLDQAVMTPQDITAVPLTIDNHYQAWLENDLDAIITFEPVASHIVQENGAHRLFDSRKMPDMIFDVLVVKSEIAHKRGKTLRHLINQHFNALHHFRINPMDASHRMSARLDLSPESVLELFRGLVIPDELANYAYLSKQDDRLVDATEHLVNVMTAAGIMVEDCDLRNIFTNNYIPRGRL